MVGVAAGTVVATAVAMFACALFAGSALGALLAGGLAQADRYALIFGWAGVIAIPLGLAATLGRARFTDPERPPAPAPR